MRVDNGDQTFPQGISPIIATSLPEWTLIVYSIVDTLYTQQSFNEFSLKKSTYVQATI